jgi:hypothetical protein
MTSPLPTFFHRIPDFFTVILPLFHDGDKLYGNSIYDSFILRILNKVGAVSSSL